MPSKTTMPGVGHSVNSPAMLFAVVQPFSPACGEGWKGYCSWRGITFDRFDSVDRILRPSLFSPNTAADWEHVIAADFRTHLIKDYDYALEARQRIGRGDIVGLRFEDHDERHPGFAGYDIIDGYCSVSLLTNWGNDIACINEALSPNALVRCLETARRIHQELLQKHASDAHVEGSQIVSVYNLTSDTGDRF